MTTAAAQRLLIVVPDNGVNRDIPDLNAVYAATYLDATIVDYNTSPTPVDRHLQLPAETLGLSVRSLGQDAARHAAEEYRRCHPGATVRSIEGVLETQCCYPYVALDPPLTVNATFGDGLRVPEYERLDSFSVFERRWRRGEWSYPLMTSRGCPFGCRYCAARRTGWRARSPGDCVTELVSAQERWGIRRFEVLDDCFNVTGERVVEFCRRVAPLGLRWACTNGLRADLLDERQCQALAEAGCERLSLGIESTDPEVLAASGKGETVADFERAIAIGRKYFKTINGYFIIGLPGSSYASDLASRAWAQRHGINAHFSFFVPEVADRHPEPGALFYGPHARPLSDAYPADQQQRLYDLTRAMRPADGLARQVGGLVSRLQSWRQPRLAASPTVLHVTNYLPGYHRSWGGAERVCARVVEAQRARALDARVVTLRPQTPYRDRLPVSSVPVVGDHLGGRVPFKAFDPVSTGVLAYRLRRAPPKLLHLHNVNVLSPGIILAAHAQGIPVVWSIYDYWAICPRETLVDHLGQRCRRFHGPHCGRCLAGGRWAPVESAKLLVRTRTLEALLGRVSRFVALSQDSADLLAEAGLPASRLRVVHQPLGAETLPDLSGPGDGRTILFVGWLQERKGLHLLVEAVAQLVARHPDVRLEVLDLHPEPGYRERIDEAVARHGLSSRIRWHGRVPADEYHGWLARAAVVAVPEQWDNMSPVVVAEALAMGRPVVASRVGGIPEFVIDGRTGRLAEPGSASSLAAALSWVLEHPEGAQGMAAEGRQLALREFSAERAAATLEEVYQEVMGGQRAE